MKEREGKRGREDRNGEGESGRERKTEEQRQRIVSLSLRWSPASRKWSLPWLPAHQESSTVEAEGPSSHPAQLRPCAWASLF